jgi:hypothetical protein
MSDQPEPEITSVEAEEVAVIEQEPSPEQRLLQYNSIGRVSEVQEGRISER